MLGSSWMLNHHGAAGELPVSSSLASAKGGGGRFPWANIGRHQCSVHRVLAGGLSGTHRLWIHALFGGWLPGKRLIFYLSCPGQATCATSVLLVSKLAYTQTCEFSLDICTAGDLRAGHQLPSCLTGSTLCDPPGLPWSFFPQCAWCSLYWPTGHRSSLSSELWTCYLLLIPKAGWYHLPVIPTPFLILGRVSDGQSRCDPCVTWKCVWFGFVDSPLVLR